MHFTETLQQVLAFTGSLNIQLVILLYLITAIGEFGFSIPYLLETIWILTGYHLATGSITPVDMGVIWVASQAGRQTGASLLYYLSRFGSMPLIKLYQRRFAGVIQSKTSENTIVLPLRVLRKINFLSSFSVAFGRLVWLRIPLTLTLAIRRDLKTLVLAVLLQSLAWDGVYIFVGIIGGRVVPKPYLLVLYSLIGLTALYSVTLVVRYLSRIWSAKLKAKDSEY